MPPSTGTPPSPRVGDLRGGDLARYGPSPCQGHLEDVDLLAFNQGQRRSSRGTFETGVHVKARARQPAVPRVVRIGVSAGANANAASRPD